MDGELGSSITGEPDRLRKNPHYKNGSPMRLYAIDRIEHLERSSEFVEAFEALQKKRMSAAKAPKGDGYFR